MARSTYGTRLEALAANPAISSRDKTFAESLLRFYTSKRRLTAGRARCRAGRRVASRSGGHCSRNHVSSSSTSRCRRSIVPGARRSWG